MAFIHNPSTQTSAREDISLSSLIYLILHNSEINTIDVPDLSNFLKEAIEDYLNMEDKIKMPFIEQVGESQEIPISNSEKINPARSFGWQLADKVQAQTYWKGWNSFTRKTLKLSETDTAIIVNGRVCTFYTSYFIGKNYYYYYYLIEILLITNRLWDLL
jgi:hypothetical protein